MSDQASFMFYFGTNLKMNQTPDEAAAFVARLGQLDVPRDVQLWVIPSYTNLARVADACAQAHIWLGAQNMHWADDGAYTGEISPVQLKACGANLVMLGHAERRTLFGETDETVNRKVLAAARHQLRILLCVGETAAEKQAGTGHRYVSQQLILALAGLDDPQAVLVLYEPVWSIGAGGVPADPAEVAGAFANIRHTLHQRYGAAGDAVPILYGGSVNARNAADYARLPDCAGLGVGRAAWQADGFADVLRNALPIA